jgi:ubiquinone/menaquinone biosynthesis C-methylase UbiE
MNQNNIDNELEFDFGKTSYDYSKYRDIYPDSMYKKIYEMGIGHKNQNILDIGTGTGVLPRAMYKYGAKYTGLDISENQIKYAGELSKKQNMDIAFKICPAESTGLNSKEYDVITAAQCFVYFDKMKTIPEIKRLLKDDGKLVIIYMSWLPYESKVTEETINLILKYKPKWIEAGSKHSNTNDLFRGLNENFEEEKIINYKEDIEFNYETWAGRIRSSRMVSAELSENIVKEFNEEHIKMLKEITQEPFKIIHEIQIGIYLDKKMEK